MDNFIPAWVPGMGGVVTTVVAIITARKLVFELKNLRSRGVKELLDLIDEAGNRFEKELANVLWKPDAKPPRGSFEDSLAKDLLVSQIFGRAITWSDWIEIREFLMDHDNVRMKNLRYAWFYRDQTQAPHICFRMTWRIRWGVRLYFFIAWLTGLLFWFGLVLVQLYFNPLFLKWLISLSPQLPKLLTSFGIHASDQLLALGAKIIPLSLLAFILNVIFFWDLYEAFLICKKTESLR